MMNKHLALLYTTTLILMLAGCGTVSQTEQIESRTATQASESESNAVQTETFPIQSESETEKSFQVGQLGDDYILPDVSAHTYDRESLSKLTQTELKLARNEIYAKHGRIFKSDDLNHYFSKKSWYHGTVDPDDFDDQLLNQNEKDNLKLIQEIEAEQAICSAPKIGIDEFPVINGSTATLPISQTLYRMATGASVQESEIAITHSKTTNAWLSLIRENNPADLVIAYEPGAEARNEIEKSGIEVITKPIGRDALVFLANRSNPVKSLTSRQIIDIYSGKLDNWKDVGGKNHKILAFQRSENSGSQNLMEKLVMKGTKMAEAPADWVSSEMGELIELISAYDNTGDALGYSVYYYANNMYQKPELKFMAVDSVVPSNATIRDSSYPLVNEFYAAIRADKPKTSKAYELFEWLTSENGQSLINGLGYVGIKDSAKRLPEELSSAEETFSASIPLPRDQVILASGRYLFGEIGIGVFDSKMHLLHFINHATSSEVGDFKECSKNAVIPITDTFTGEEGYYSIEKQQWVGLKEDADETDEDESEYELVNSFADDHPELLEKYNVTKDAVNVRYTGESLVGICIRVGNIEHYYDVYGNYLLSFDTAGKSEEELPYRFVKAIDSHMAYICLLDQGRYLIYQDGVLVKELFSNEKEAIDSIRPYFYTRTIGNYLYFYNYQDQPCAKLLLDFNAGD